MLDERSLPSLIGRYNKNTNVQMAEIVNRIFVDPHDIAVRDKPLNRKEEKVKLKSSEMDIFMMR